MIVTRDAFGKDFSWGVSSAAYQTEGAHEADGKGPSIWDAFTARPGRIRNEHHGRVACDFYRRFPDDLTLMSAMGIPNYRFSIAWSRILPQGTGAVNPGGLGYYDRLIDACLARGIEPWVTLYHWDLPQALEEKGGWTNRDVLGWFAEFIRVCIDRYGDRVKHWMVLNEPMVFTGAGYFLGVHAPGKRGLRNFLAATHHAALAQAEGGRAIRSLRGDLRIGTTFSYSHIEPYRHVAADKAAAVRTDALLNRLFIEPLLGLGYPWKDVPVLKRLEKYFLPGDDRALAFDMDFVGLQNYTRELVRHAPLVPWVRARIVRASRRRVTHTQMDWEIYPASLYKSLRRYAAYPNMPDIVITENGAAFEDDLREGAVNDESRRQFLEDHIEQVGYALRRGVPVKGYFVWTFTDNFEWAEGYRPRFGLVHVDFETQRRIVKASGAWYGRFIGEMLGR